MISWVIWLSCTFFKQVEYAFSAQLDHTRWLREVQAGGATATTLTNTMTTELQTAFPEVADDLQVALATNSDTHK